ncbi:hypothetical protein [Elizabethkingia meningoseptica]|nr:hypothetical protein [Elizabethkingia meningoseptica]
MKRKIYNLRKDKIQKTVVYDSNNRYEIESYFIRQFNIRIAYK